MFNKVILVGNLTRDVELRYAGANNMAIGNTAIAVNRKFTTNGEKREEICFIDIVFFARQAEIANQYLSKGSKVLIEGRLRYEQWTDNNGNNRSRHKIEVENLEMLGSQNENSQAPQQMVQNNNTQSDYSQNRQNQQSYNNQAEFSNYPNDNEIILF